MTTKHSSLQPTALIDSRGQTLNLGQQIGKGGEGAIFEVEGQRDLVAKIYHQKKLGPDTVAKLEAMVAQSSSDLVSIAAWPESIIYHKAEKRPCGLLMPRIKNSRQLHELYGTATRRLHFPEVRWHHMLLASRNLAAAFDTMHSAGIIVGDVNQGNLLVDSQMRVRFIRQRRCRWRWRFYARLPISPLIYRLRFFSNHRSRQNLPLPRRHSPFHTFRTPIA